MSHHSRRHFLATSAALAATSLIGPTTPATAAPLTPSPITNGLRVFTCGHSFHVWVAKMLADLAEKAGIKNHRVAGISSIGGSRVIQHWDVPDAKNAAKKALSAGEVDVLTLSPIWLPDEGIENFTRLAIEHNPNIRITVQEYWLPNDTFNPVYPLETRKIVDHNAATIPELKKQNDLYRESIESHIRDLNKKLNTKALLVVPVGAATTALREKIIAGQARPLKVQWSLFTDNWGHPSPPLKVLAAYCHFAVIYRRSPIGLPLPQEFEQNQQYANPALNRLLQQLAWDAATNNPLTGVSA
ncbi:MAG TPA: SGNH/GDSL hydrolase family protein [Pirellulaceae bacterium]|jgi:hypothetical protein